MSYEANTRFLLPTTVHLQGSPSCFSFPLFPTHLPDAPGARCAARDPLEDAGDPGASLARSPSPTTSTNCPSGRTAWRSPGHEPERVAKWACAAGRHARWVPGEGVRVSFLPSRQAASSRPPGPRESGGPSDGRAKPLSIPVAHGLHEGGEGTRPLSASHPLLSSFPTSEGAEIQPGLECRNPLSPVRDSPVPKLTTGTNTTAFRISDRLCEMATGLGREQ